MKSDQMWQTYKILNQTIGDKIDAWAFGVEADYLAELVLMGQKTATSSAFDLYAVGNEPLPKENELSSFLIVRRMLFVLLKRRKLRSSHLKRFLKTMLTRKVKETVGQPIGKSFMRISLANGCMRLDYILVRTV